MACWESEGAMASPLNVVAYSDQRPGHFKQTQAVISALQALTPVAVNIRRLVPTNGIRRLFHGLGTFLPLQKPVTKGLPKDIDLIIGTGSGTHLPMIALKWRCRAKLVTCMSPDPLLRSWFDLCLIPRHDNPPERRNILATFGPPCLKIERADHDPHRGLILVGGIDPKSHHWNSALLINQVQDLRAGMPRMSWTISSSPRTPVETIEGLVELTSKKDQMHFFRAAETPPGWLESAYAAHGQVWVTADSVSMVYEALTAGCRVGILPVVWKHSQNKFQSGVDDLKSHGLVLDFDQWRNGRAWPAAAAALNEAGRCALEILKRWWPERLA
jgi:uncharacterized protein